MAVSNINLGVVIDSKISSNFGSSINTANEKLNSFGQSVENLNSKKISVNNIEEMTSKLNMVSGTIKKLQNEKMSLEIELETASFDTDTEKISKRISDLDIKIGKLNTHKTLLSFDLKEAKSNIEEVTKSVTKLDKIIESTNKHKLNIEANVQKREDLKKGIFDKFALGASVVIPIRASIDFESKMSDVKKVVDFESNEELKLFERDILKLSRTIPLSANELTEITASGGQLGIAKDELLNFTTVVSKMSTAFDIAPKEAGKSIAEIMRVYKLGIDEAQLLGDAVNHLADNVGVEAPKVVEVINRIGGTAKIFGISAVEASALSTAFISLGKAPEVAATSINTLLGNLVNADKQGNKFQEALATIGFSATELKEKISKDANGTLQEFLTTLSKVDKSEQMGILTDLFGTGFADDIALLVGSLEQYDKALDLTADSQKYMGSTQREFEAKSATTANNLQLLKNSVNEIAINFGNIFLPAINLVATSLRFVSTNIADLMNSSPIIGGLIKTVTGLFGAFVAVSVGGTALAYAMTFVSSGFSRLALLGNLLKLVYVGLTTGTALATAKTFLFATAQKVATATSFVFGGALKILGGAIGLVSKAIIWMGRALMMNPIGLAITAIGVAAYTIYTYWEPIKGFFAGLWDGIKSVFNSGLTFIKEYLGWTPVGLILNNWEPISNFFLSLWDGIKSIFSGSFTAIQNILSFNPFEVITQAWSGVFNWFSEKFDFVTKGIEKLKNLGATVGDFFSFGSKEDDKVSVLEKTKAVNFETNTISSINNTDYNPYSVMKPLNLGSGYNQSLQNSIENTDVKTSNTNYTNNTSKNASDVSSIVININNPVVESKEQVKVLEKDIRKVVDIALKEKEQSYKNRTLKDVA